jgi:hypothetical protein
VYVIFIRGLLSDEENAFIYFFLGYIFLNKKNFEQVFMSISSHKSVCNALEEHSFVMCGFYAFFAFIGMD